MKERPSEDLTLPSPLAALQLTLVRQFCSPELDFPKWLLANCRSVLGEDAGSLVTYSNWIPKHIADVRLRAVGNFQET